MNNYSLYEVLKSQEINISSFLKKQEYLYESNFLFLGQDVCWKLLDIDASGIDNYEVLEYNLDIYLHSSDYSLEIFIPASSTDNHFDILDREPVLSKMCILNNAFFTNSNLMDFSVLKITKPMPEYALRKISFHLKRILELQHQEIASLG